MARIVALGTAVPPYHLDAAAFQAAAMSAFAANGADPRLLARMAAHCGVRERYIAAPVETVLVPRPLDERNRAYTAAADELGEGVARAALAAAGVAPAEVDLIVSVSCTGYLLPSLDARLAAPLGLRPDVRRLPITELGCLAGAAALARTVELLHAPGLRTALVVAAEFPSLTFQPGDASMDNLVSTLVFADGAAAAVLRVDDGPGFEIVATASRILPGTLDEMGFELREGGFYVVLSKDVPALLAEPFAEATAQLLAKSQLATRDLGFACIHPGGPKILRAVDAALGVEGLTAPSWQVLERFGNQSSASVLFILDYLQRCAPPADGSFGLLAGFGPGLSLELALLRFRA
ncbi:MAG TPA: 3-oxoacyl-[acyl-carrier-protein] synthase III C-terminal domain-containing protein [Dehalococcoidia bacterium]|nr:3-oxoacyl-[acyl-carrier-protein] synthase III C-terminal domain-containing protein [Dehalococcoidia bacterium]